MAGLSLLKYFATCNRSTTVCAGRCVANGRGRPALLLQKRIIQRELTAFPDPDCVADPSYQVHDLINV